MKLCIAIAIAIAIAARSCISVAAVARALSSLMQEAAAVERTGYIS